MPWLANGLRRDVMRYLHRQARKRKDPRLIVPEAKSVVVVLDNYYYGDHGARARAEGGAVRPR